MTSHLLEFPHNPGALTASSVTHIDLTSGADVPNLKAVNVTECTVIHTGAGAPTLRINGRDYPIPPGRPVDLVFGAPARWAVLTIDSTAVASGGLQFIWKGAPK